MKPPCKPPAIALAAILQLFTIHSYLSTAFGGIPTEWTVRIGPRSAVYQAERRHGDALDLKASLVYNGQPLAYTGPARLYAQTNGMGAAWWDLAPCTVTSNVLKAVWLPAFDTGADVVDLFLGGPSNYQAAARIRFLPSPGSEPNALPLPVPVLDFATVTITNSPFATFEDLATATNEVLQAALRAAPSQISDGTNAIDAARNVYTIYKDAWRTADGSNIFTNRAGSLDWYSIYQNEYEGSLAPAGYVAWAEDAMSYVGQEGPGWYFNLSDYGGPESVYPGGTNATELGGAALVRGDWPVPVGRVALTNDISQAISTNNAAFVSAVLASPLVGADASDLAELSEYGSYGTVGAALLALIAGLAALKRRMTSAETALVQKASLTDLPYALVTPGVAYELSAETSLITYFDGEAYVAVDTVVEPIESGGDVTGYMLKGAGVSGSDIASFSADGSFVRWESSGWTVGDGEYVDPQIVLTGHLLDRAVNAVSVSAATTLTLPAANPGHSRDLYVCLTVSATSAVTWTVAQGETWDAAGAPPSSFAAGTYLYRITEVAAGVFHCKDMLALVGLEAALAGKIPMYPMVAVTPSSGTLTVAPYTVATYTADSTAAAFTMAVGAGTTGKARDCELVIDCTATGAVAPTVTWPATFHPRTDAGTDFACEAGVRNVYYISEYAQGEFAVGGWQETVGGNA